jgi:hypothetical protein
MELNRHNFIEKTPFDEPSEDFDFLVKKGIELLQKLTGNTWTDYNPHDPGITILEQLCFAFTDLSYRTGFDIKDILSDEKGRISKVKNSFFNKEKVLSTNPISINDYRKVILDEVEEVDNIDLIPLTSNYSSSYIRGFYEMRVKLKDYLADKQKNDPKSIANIQNKIKEVFVAKRNLGENLCEKIVLLEPQTINIHAEILTKEFVHAEDVLLEIYLKIQEYLSPQIRFYSELELTEKNIRIEQIYDGPLLKQGILPDSELRNMSSEIDVFKLISAVSSANGVLLVQKLSIDNQNEFNAGHSFLLNKNSYPIIDPNTFADSIKLFSGEYRLTSSKKEFLTLLNKSISLKHFSKNKSRHVDLTKYLAGGNFINLGSYTSIQENFPHIYGLGKYGVFANESSDRKAKVKQLRAYIFFFEQVLINYLAQLENLSNFFATDLEHEGSRSFYSKPLYDIRGANEIIAGTTDKHEWESFTKDGNNTYMNCLNNEQETVSDFRRRKHKAFEHIYARFNEVFVKYPINAFIHAYGDINEDKAGLMLKWKAGILRSFVETEYNRVQAFNYLEERHSLGGFEKKVMRLLNIGDEEKKRLTSNFETDKIAFVSSVYPGEMNNSSYVVNWGNEKLEIISETDETFEQVDNNKQSDNEITQNQSYVFQEEGISVLKFGINYDNYRILPSSKNENEYIIVYRKPSQLLWRSISRHPSKEIATEALDKLISYLKKISIESEGFHVVEHILLCPPPDSNSFGFRFLTANNTDALKNRSWTNFSTREEIITELIESAVHSQTTVENKHQPFTINKVQLLTSDAQQLHEDLKAFASNKSGVFPYFEMVVKDSSGKIVQEEFYNMRVTVVLPSWPARFQDPEFKSFVESLFNSASPAHICFNFKWLGIKKMQEFETLYFPWIKSLKNQENLTEISEKLSRLIGCEKFVVSSY